MSLYQKASLVQIPSGYKAADAKLYSVVPNNGDGDFTVSSDADATRVNKDGLIQTTVANQARLNYDPTNPQDPHLLLEPTSTNLLQRSEDYANSYWLKARVGSSATGFTAPDGSSNATYYEQASGQTTAAVIYKSAFTSASSGVYTFSIWAKKAEKRYLKLQTRVNSSTYRTVFDLQDGVITYDSGNENAKIEEYPNGWYRLSVQRTSTTTDDIVVYYYLNDSAGASDTVADSGGVYIWGSQVEKKDYLTSYIPTTTAQVTRTFDSCLNGGDATLFNDSEGTLFVEARVFDNTDSATKCINISSGNNSNYITIQWTNPSKIVFALWNGSYQVLADTTAYNTEEYLKIAFRYKENDVAAYVNGNLVLTDTNASMFAEGSLNTLDFRIGTLPSDYYFYGNTKQLMYFDTALTDQELIQLTS